MPQLKGSQPPDINRFSRSQVSQSFQQEKAMFCNRESHTLSRLRRTTLQCLRLRMPTFYYSIAAQAFIRNRCIPWKSSQISESIFAFLSSLCFQTLLGYPFINRWSWRRNRSHRNKRSGRNLYLLLRFSTCFSVGLNNSCRNMERLPQIPSDLSRIAADTAHQDAQSKKPTDLHHLVSVNRQRIIQLKENCHNRSKKEQETRHGYGHPKRLAHTQMPNRLQSLQTQQNQGNSNRGNRHFKNKNQRLFTKEASHSALEKSIVKQRLISKINLHS